jgi:hypothetical protein
MGRKSLATYNERKRPRMCRGAKALFVALRASLVVVGAVPASGSESSGAVAWGENNDGQLGNDTTTNEKEAVAVKVLTEATAVAAGEFHSLALLKDGKVMAWGYNNDGQLGNGTTTTEKEPVEVKSISEAIAVAGGEWARGLLGRKLRGRAGRRDGGIQQ